MVSVFEMATQGFEEVLTCRDCGCKSTDDVQGAAAFTHVLRGGGCIRVCRKCADIAKHGQAGLMAVLTKETRDSMRRLQLVGLQDVRVQVFPARPATAQELEAHAALVARYRAESGMQ